jgi:hypothetical protein
MAKVKNKYIIEADDGLIKFLPIGDTQAAQTANPAQGGTN